MNPQLKGTKAAIQYKFTVPLNGEVSIKLRLSKDKPGNTAATALGPEFEKTFAVRKAEADAFYSTIIPSTTR